MLPQFQFPQFHFYSTICQNYAWILSTISGVITVFRHLERGLSLVYVRLEIQKLTVKNKSNESLRTAFNFDLVFVAVFPFKWKNRIIVTNFFRKFVNEDICIVLKKKRILEKIRERTWERIARKINGEKTLLTVTYNIS